MPDVALIIPCFNHAATLERAVASGLKQQALREIIIVSDCSSDVSWSLACSLSANEARVRAVRSPSNGGPAAARNLGVAQAQASHVAFLNADDELIADYFADALAMIAAAPGMRAVKPVQEFFDPVKGYLLPEHDPRYRAAVLGSVRGLVIEREAFLALGGFPTDPVIRGPFGGEGVAFMRVVMEHLQPLDRINHPCYRVWNCAGSYHEKFLANTRMTEDGKGRLSSSRCIPISNRAAPWPRQSKHICGRSG